MHNYKLARPRENIIFHIYLVSQYDQANIWLSIETIAPKMVLDCLLLENWEKKWLQISFEKEIFNSQQLKFL